MDDYEIMKDKLADWQRTLGNDLRDRVADYATDKQVNWFQNIKTSWLNEGNVETQLSSAGLFPVKNREVFKVTTDLVNDKHQASDPVYKGKYTLLKQNLTNQDADFLVFTFEYQLYNFLMDTIRANEGLDLDIVNIKKDVTYGDSTTVTYWITFKQDTDQFDPNFKKLVEDDPDLGPLMEDYSGKEVKITDKVGNTFLLVGYDYYVMMENERYVNLALTLLNSDSRIHNLSYNNNGLYGEDNDEVPNYAKEYWDYGGSPIYTMEEFDLDKVTIEYVTTNKLTD